MHHASRPLAVVALVKAVCTCFCHSWAVQHACCSLQLTLCWLLAKPLRASINCCWHIHHDPAECVARGQQHMASTASHAAASVPTPGTVDVCGWPSLTVCYRSPGMSAGTWQMCRASVHPAGWSSCCFGETDHRISGAGAAAGSEKCTGPGKTGFLKMQHQAAQSAPCITGVWSVQRVQAGGWRQLNNATEEVAAHAVCLNLLLVQHGCDPAASA